jgi:hypothetical protein
MTNKSTWINKPVDCPDNAATRKDLGPCPKRGACQRCYSCPRDLK